MGLGPLPLFLAVRLTHLAPTRLKLRLGLFEAWHAIVCLYAERRMNVEGRN
jgi:hypothetical protein